MHQVLAIDVGTSAIKVAAFDVDGQATATVGVERGTRRDGERFEQSPAETIDIIRHCIAEVGGRTDLRSIGAISLSAQRGTVVPLSEDGTPVGPYITWMDRRGLRWLEWIADVVGRDRYYELCGHPVVPITGITKLLAVRADSSTWERTAVVGTQQTHLLSWLGASDLYCDRSLASFHFPLEAACDAWSAEILELTQFPVERLPRLVHATEVVGELGHRAAGDLGLPQGIPLVAGGGDGQCAGAGVGAIASGVTLVNIGTAAGVLVPADRPLRDPAGVLNCAAHVVPGLWELEGHTQASGVALRWFRDCLAVPAGTAPHTFDQLVESSSEIPAGAEGLTFVPTLNGATAPRLLPGMQAAFVGLQLGHDRRHMVRALLEGVCLEIRSIFDAVEASAGQQAQVRVAGGASRSLPWMQILADILARPIYISGRGEAALVGAAMCAAVATGRYSSMAAAAERFVDVAHLQEVAPVDPAAYTSAYTRYCEAFETVARLSVEHELAGVAA